MKRVGSLLFSVLAISLMLGIASGNASAQGDNSVYFVTYYSNANTAGVGLFAVGLIVLLIYKSTLTMHEDDQLFLDDANSHMQEEQTELLTKVNKLTVPMRVFSIGSGVFLLAFLAMLIYQKLNEVQ